MPDWLSSLIKPLTNAPSRLAKRAADTIDNPQGEGGRLRGFLAGATEGAGDLVSDMTSPLSIGMSAIGAGGLKRLSSLKKMMPRTNNPNLANTVGRLGPEFTPVGSEAMENTFRAGKMAEEAKRVSDMSRAMQARRMGIDPSRMDDLPDYHSNTSSIGSSQADEELLRFQQARLKSKERFNVPRQY